LENDALVQKILNMTQSGGVCVNATIEHILGLTLPFGGVGESGMGAYHGHVGFLEFTHQRAVMYKDTTLLTTGLPFHHAPAFLYDFAVKYLVIGFGLTPQQVGYLQGGFTMGALAVVYRMFF
jgi:aldehyde dehydrogenase (NAD+)